MLAGLKRFSLNNGLYPICPSEHRTSTRLLPYRLAPVQTLDIFPTLASLCGLTPPADVQGHDLKALLEDPLTKWIHPAFSVAGSATNLHRSVRVDQWRYIDWSGKDGGAALIDETNNPREQINLINEPAHAQTREKLRNMLRTLP